MLDCTPDAYWLLILTYVLPPVGALLSAIALSVARRAAGTSEDARSTSQAAVSLSLLHSEPPGHNGYRMAAPDPKKR